MDFIQAKGLGHVFKIKDKDGNVTGESWAIKDVDLLAHKGEKIAILGKNGSGKSTFAKHLNGLYAPDAGTVCICPQEDASVSYDTSRKEDLISIRQLVGMVFQNPDNQMVGNTVADDIGFGLENLSMQPDTIWERVHEVVTRTGLDAYIDRSVMHLSGGQKQRLAVASVLAMRPSCIVMDEATSMLDPQASREIMDFVLQLNKEAGITILMITHRIEETYDMDQIYVMENGQVAWSGRPQEIYPQEERLMELGLEPPEAYRLAKRLGMSYKEDHILTIQETAAWAKRELTAGRLTMQDVENAGMRKCDAARSGALLIQAEHVTYHYTNEKQRIPAVKDVSFEVKKGEFLAVAGMTGSGKSTLLYMLNGLLRPEAGSLLVDGMDVRTTKDLKALRRKIGFVFQYPDDQLFANTVLADVMFAPLNFGRSKEEAETSAKEALRLVGIPEEWDMYAPFVLSGGQKKKVALAGILAYQPELLILDEPTAGMDPEAKRELFALLQHLNQERNVTVIFVSHDMKDVYEMNSRLIVMNQGEIAFDGSTSDAFHDEKMAAELGLAMPELATFYRTICR